MLTDPSAVELVPREEMGRGYDARALDQLRMKALRERLGGMRADLRERGLALALLRTRLVEAEADFRRDCANGLGQDFVQDALKMFGDEAAALLKEKRGSLTPLAEVAATELASATAKAEQPKAKKAS